MINQNNIHKIKRLAIPFLISPMIIQWCIASDLSEPEDTPQYSIKKTKDFDINGSGKADVWKDVEWMTLKQKRTYGENFDTRAKLLYSQSGIYVLFHCEDKILTATHTEDNEELWKEDVVEIFLWPNPAVPVYFEYELSPLNVELAILVPNLDGKFKGWLPWQYQDERLIKRQTSAQGGDIKSMAKVDSWRAEFFIPFELLKPLVQKKPQSGTVWRANLYRLDHDSGQRASWEWAPVTDKFHDYEKFGFVVFD